MGDHNLRKKDRFDYKKLSQTGVKVLLPCESVASMSTESKVAGELAGMLFQIGELLEDLDDIRSMSLNDLQNNYDELKNLRVSLVKVNTELKVLQGDKYNDDMDKDIKEKLSLSKINLNSIKAFIAAEEDKIDKVNIDARHKQEVKIGVVENARRFAYDKVVAEVISLINNLTVKYDISGDDNLTRDEVLNRKEMKANYSLDHNRLKTLIDRLLEYTDVSYEGKELDIDAQILKMPKLNESRELFEEKLRNDLEMFDLTEQKLKLASTTRVNIGKFSGSLEKGMDFYTFQIKFERAYSNHPKSLLVELLTNNHLEGKARDCVGSLTDIDEIWNRLRSNFGNTELLLEYQFKRIHQLGIIRNLKSYESKRHYLQSLINAMQDVYDIAAEHGLESELHYGGQLKKVVGLLDNYMQSSWYKVIAEEDVSKPDRWNRMLRFLTDQLKIIQIRASETSSVDGSDNKDTRDKRPPKNVQTGDSSAFLTSVQCKLCDEKHPNPNSEFILCKKFLKMSPKERAGLVRKKRCCLQCLDGKTKWQDDDHQCSNDWICANEYHNRYEKKLHFLICDQHVSDEANKQLYEKFKDKVLIAEWQKKLHCSIYVSLPESFPAGRGIKTSKEGDEPIDSEEYPDARDYGTPSYILQPYPFDNHIFNLMFDSGCHNFVCRSAAVDRLPETHKKNTMSGPIVISGVGCNQVESEYGQYTVKLPAHDGRLVKFTGICLEVITGTMPPYPVKEASKSIIANYVSKGGKESDLPEVPLLVGGETDFLIGIQYNYFQPRLVHILPTGLAIYESFFRGVDNTRGCIGGSHDIFAQCERQFMESNSNIAQFKVFLQQQIQLFNNGMRVCLDYDAFNHDSGVCDNESDEANSLSNDGTLDNVLISKAVAVKTESSLKESVEGEKFVQDVLVVNTGANFNNANQVIESNVVMSVYDIAVVNEDRLDQRPLVLSVAKIKRANEADNAGSSIQYRCVKCRGCVDCRNGEQIENISLREEREQSMINSSVKVELENFQALAVLPFMFDPEEKLTPNRRVALKVYKRELNKLSNSSELKDAVIHSESKLQDAGHVDWFDELQEHEKEMIQKGVRHYLPWRVVHNENSISTPVRLVFDASAVTSSGFSLNDLLPKGINSINSLLEIFLRWRTWPVAIHTDVKKMYNVIKLLCRHWKFQMYLWSHGLDPLKDPTDKVIKTLIYGVRSSGNQAQVALRRTAELQKKEYPKASESIIEDTYVDDCATGTITDAKADDLVGEITEVLAHGGFSVKGFTISGRPPLPTLTKDGTSINVAGIKWYPEDDRLKLALGPLNFAKKVRGKKTVNENSAEVPEKLSKRICAGKTAEIFYFSGIILPIMSGFKIDLHELHMLSYSWDDEISGTEKEKWLNNFEVMKTLGNLSWSRAVVPVDAESLDMELIGAGDASPKIACSACYVRFRRRSGELSCQLLLAKSKIVAASTSLPRAELLAATVNTHATEIVKRSLKKYVTNSIYVLDSEITLYWIAAWTKPLKPWIRNRVVEISRFTDVSQWYHVDSNANPADIATRKGANLNDISDGSEWINGKPWMTQPIDKLRGSVLKNINELKLKAEQQSEVQREQLRSGSDLCRSDFHLLIQDVSDDKGHLPTGQGVSKVGLAHETSAKDKLSVIIKERLQFSSYLIDPNKFRFRKVVRVLAIVIKATKIWLTKINHQLHRFSSENEAANDESIHISEITKMFKVAAVATTSKGLFATPFIQLSDSDIQYSLSYFFLKGTEELRSFVHPKQYVNTSVEKNGIIYYTGRVSNCDISFDGDITDKMVDLSKKSFIVPIIDGNSPLAFSVVNEVHWHDPTANHSGVETTIRAIMTIAHILKVRQLVKLFRNNCTRCRYILKKTVEVTMGPASKQQLCVAPPFYVTQTDICGPFNSFSTHNKRTVLKIWILVFVCATTGTTCLKIMEGYSTIQFLLAFSRFACELGYPKKLLIDEGGQLVSGCESVVLNMVDLKGCLNREYGMEFSTCPVGGHNYHGKVERKIRTVQETLMKSIHKSRLSVLEWETLCSEVSNSINNLPVAIGNEVEDLENIDLITPNRLRLARNNNRSPIGPLEVTGKIDKMLYLKTSAFQAWWEAWLVSALPKLLPKPKWFKNEEDIKKGDIILFNKSEGSLFGEYKYGIVDDVCVGSDNRIRSVTVKYRNASENIYRTTFRAVRSLIIIHRVDEINIMQELGEAAINVSAYFYHMEFSS